MSLLVEQLSVWEIGFRCENRDPQRVWFRIPLGVQDQFRTLILAILNAELPCVTITLEKPSELHPVDPEWSIYRYIDDMYACIAGQRFNRKMLRWALIDRYDFKLWCERRKVPLPAFWFPPGWNLQYELPDDDLLPGHSYIRRNWTPEQWASWREDQESRSKGGTSESAGSATPEPVGPDAKAAEKLRPSHEARIACCQIATAIWREDPTRTIASVVRDELVQKYGGGAHFNDETVRAWIKVVAPPEVRRPGRPRKNGGGSE